MKQNISSHKYQATHFSRTRTCDNCLLKGIFSVVEINSFSNQFSKHLANERDISLNGHLKVLLLLREDRNPVWK